MAAEQLNQVVRRLRGMVAIQEAAGVPDADLLKRYVRERDETAFETLVRRHGPMVQGVCRRLLHNPHDAEDAFQVTFLVLLRKASALHSPGTIGNWLYGVAYRTALEARKASAKRRVKEAMAVPRAEPLPDNRADLRLVLDRELKRLPDKHREVVVLCDLEGKTRKEVALDLGCAEGTVASRLARARTVLAKRLTRHGLPLSAGALAVLLSENVASACVPASVISWTIKAAGAYAAGPAAAAGAISTNVIALTHGVLRTMLLTKMKIATAVLVAITVVGVGAGNLIYHSQAADSKDQNNAAGRDQPKVSQEHVEGLILRRVFSRDALQSAAADQSDSWGTIKGQIFYDGDSIPEPKALNITKDQEHCLANGPILSEDWVINKKNKGMRWTFVWLAPEPGGASLPIHPSLKDIPNKEMEIDQPRCAFVPHCLAMREGQVLVAKNSSPIAHNVHWAGTPLKNLGGNMIIPAGGTIKIEGLKEDKYPLLVGCDIHTWMNARVGVFAHPYFAVTDEDGNFEIKLAPAGEHRLKVYHESVGWRGGSAGRNGEKITVKGGDVTDLGKLGLKPGGQETVNLKAAAPAGEEITVEAMPPVVVKTVPQAGLTNVDAKTTEIQVTFSKVMMNESWSWSQLSDDTFPKIIGKPKYLEDKRTCVVTVKLEADKTYAIWLNSERFHNFKDADGRAAVPYLLVFKTAK